MINNAGVNKLILKSHRENTAHNINIILCLPFFVII